MNGGFEIVARNAVSTRLSDGKVITYPNFVPFIRSTAHKRNGKYLLTLFNYHEKQPLILEIRQKRPVKGSPFPMLVRIEPQGCALAGTDFIQEQKALREAVKNYSGQGKIFKTLSRKGKKIFWTADAAMRPVLRMEDGNGVASIDSSNNCEQVSFITKEGAELFGGGFAGRGIFSDRLQLPLKFEMEDYKFTKEGFPCFTAVSTVVPYDGASPIPKPLYKMVVRIRIPFFYFVSAADDISLGVVPDG